MINDVQIRWLIRRDMPQILEIEEACNREFPVWDEADFQAVLEKRNCIGMVAEIDDMIIGYMIYTLEKTHVEFVRFVIDPHIRREGVGSLMLSRIKDKLSAVRRHTVQIMLRESNLDAHIFFGLLGFSVKKESGFYPEYYFDTEEDGYLFAYSCLPNDSHFAPEWKPKNRISNYMGNAQL